MGMHTHLIFEFNCARFVLFKSIISSKFKPNVLDY